MGRRIKERSHKRRKVSLTRKRRKTGKSRYSKRIHKRKMMGGMQGQRALGLGNSGQPLTHTARDPFRETPDHATMETQQKKEATNLLTDLQTEIQGYYNIVMKEPDTLENYKTVFNKLKNFYYRNYRKTLQMLLQSADDQGLT